MSLKVQTRLTSPAFNDNSPIPAAYSWDGRNVSPPLRWDVPPEMSRGLVLIMDDPDAPSGTWVHWLVYDIPPDADRVEEGVPNVEMLDNGARQGMSDGVTEFSTLGYSGPHPPPGPAHRYFFKLYALDKKLGLGPRATKQQVLESMEGHVLGEGVLVGLYGRPAR